MPAISTASASASPSSTTILRQHGGTLAFSDRPGGGLAVTVTLPITEAA